MSSIPITVNAIREQTSKSHDRSQIARQVYRIKPYSPSNEDGNVFGNAYENGISCKPVGNSRS